MTVYKKWRELIGILCDPKIPVTRKGKIYKIVSKSVLLFGSEKWAVNKKIYIQLEYICMIQWTRGITMKDQVRNEICEAV